MAVADPNEEQDSADLRCLGEQGPHCSRHPNTVTARTKDRKVQNKIQTLKNSVLSPPLYDAILSHV